MRRLLEDVIQHDSSFNDFEVTDEFHGIGNRYILLNARRLDSLEGGPERILLGKRGGLITTLALTAYARAEDAQRALEVGYQAHIPKPVEPGELAMAVASLVGRGRDD